MGFPPRAPVPRMWSHRRSQLDPRTRLSASPRPLAERARRAPKARRRRRSVVTDRRRVPALASRGRGSKHRVHPSLDPVGQPRRVSFDRYHPRPLQAPRRHGSRFSTTCARSTARWSARRAVRHRRQYRAPRLVHHQAAVRRQGEARPHQRRAPIAGRARCAAA